MSTLNINETNILINVFFDQLRNILILFICASLKKITTTIILSCISYKFKNKSGKSKNVFLKAFQK